MKDRRIITLITKTTNKHAINTKRRKRRHLSLHAWISVHLGIARLSRLQSFIILVVYKMVKVIWLSLLLVAPASLAFILPCQPHRRQFRRETSSLYDKETPNSSTSGSNKFNPSMPSSSSPGLASAVRLAASMSTNSTTESSPSTASTSSSSPSLSTRWTGSSRWEQSDGSGDEQFLLKEKYGTYFKVPNPATLFTKIICTIGPKSSDPTTIGKMMDAGM